MTLAAEILARAKAQGAMIATVESCTGGLVAAALTDIPGSSAVFERGFVTYTNDAKTELVGVQAATLAAHGAVSEEVAAEMGVSHHTVDTHRRNISQKLGLRGSHSLLQFAVQNKSSLS